MSEFHVECAWCPEFGGGNVDDVTAWAKKHQCQNPNNPTNQSDGSES